MQNNDDPFYTGEVYHTPQYKLNAITRKHGLNTNTKQASSEYIYEGDKGSTSIATPDYYVEGDDYVLPPQDRDDAPEVRPRKSEKGTVQDIYDEDHYTLARNSGFGKDFGNSAVNNPSEPNNAPCKKTTTCTHTIIICFILAILGIGSVLVYVLIDRLGKWHNKCLA